MAKTKDLSPKMKIPSAEKELFMATGSEEMGQRAGGLSLFSNSFKRGYGNKVYGVDNSGMWLGSADFADAPFSVDYDGHLRASSVDLAGSGYTKLTIFKQDAIPTSIAVGDLWFDTDDGNKMYRSGSIGADAITAGEWELVGTTGLSVFAQDSIPTSVNVGDLWYDTNDNNKVYRADSVGADSIVSGEWELVSDLRAADALLKSGSSQVLSGDFQVGTGNVVIDGVNKRILINDGTYNRVLIGYQSGGF
jgi:hypothetical protein